MILGLSSYTFGWAVGVPGHEPIKRMDEHGLLDQVRAHGLKLLQIGDNVPLDTFEQSRLQALAQRAGRDGIQLEIGARKLTEQKIRRYVEIARLLGARLIRFVIDDTDFHPTPRAVIELLCETVPSLDGLVLGLENHDRFKASELRRIVDAVGSQNVGVCLDTANSLGAGEGIETVLTALAPVTVNLHIKDFQVKRLTHLMGFTITGTAAGDGLLDVPTLLESIKRYVRCPTAVLELWTPPEPDLHRTLEKEELWAERSLKFLKPLFGQAD
jgi:3-oxoisoapionate decarboxylase